MPPSIREIVTTTMRNHPKDCIFTPGAEEAIISDLESDPHLWDTECGMIDKIEAAFHRYEIYCPHEGIDKMAKYDYPELIKKGTVVGPVTPDMRERCKEKVRMVNRMMNKPEDTHMEWWPDFIPVVRKEMENEK